MESKFADYSGAIMLSSHKYVNVLDEKTGKVWDVIWIHEEHILTFKEISNPPLVPQAKEMAISVNGEKFLILNPKDDMYEILLGISFNSSRDMEITLLKRPYLSGLDFQINSEVIYYGSCSPYFGLTGTIDYGETLKEFDGTTMDNYPVFIDYSHADAIS